MGRTARCQWGLSAASGCLAVFHLNVARADDAPRPLEEKPEVSFSSDEVEGDARMRELVLRGNVVVTYERFRLTSPELGLQRTGRGIEVRGPGEVVFCPCPDPPVSVGFTGGIVAPPADLFLQNPSLRVAGTTIFALPWFWLRAPTRPGIVPPSVAWRGGDGLLIGDGVHIPWREGEDMSELDLNASAYVKGGVELLARFRTPRSTQRLRWDHLGSDLFAVDAHGSYPQPNSGAVAWDVDAIRGPRARSATMGLDEAARGYDRASAEAMFRPSSSILVGAGVRAVGARGGSGPSTRPTWGPRASLGFGGAVGSVGAWDALATATVLDDAALGPTQLARLESGFELTARPSIFLTRFTLRESVIAAEATSTSAIDAAASARAEASLPLVRAYEGETAPLVHVVEPRVQAALLAARTSGAYWSTTGRPVALSSGRVAIASAGIRSAWGRLLGRSGGSIEADVGGVAPLGDDGLDSPTPVARGRTAWSSRYIGWGAEAAARLRDQVGRIFVGKVRFGEVDGWHLALKGAGRVGVEPTVARALAMPSAQEPSGGWLAAEGWSAGAEVRAKFSRSVGATVSVEEDWTSRSLLDVHGSVGYAHPCRCISIDGFAGKRLGRDGIDVWVSIDLAPR